MAITKGSPPSTLNEITAARPINGPAERYPRGNIRSACFEFPGELIPRASLQSHRLYHPPPVEKRGHLLEELLPAVQDADTERGEHLVTRKGQEIAAELLYVHRHMRHRLGA